MIRDSIDQIYCKYPFGPQNEIEYGGITGPTEVNGVTNSPPALQYGAAAAVGNYAIFVGGNPGTGSSYPTSIQIYNKTLGDPSTAGAWSTSSTSIAAGGSTNLASTATDNCVL